MLRIGSQIAQELQQLSKLKLDFSECNLITDNGLQQLALQINTSSDKLQGLDLKFSNCDNVTDQGVEVFVSELKKNMSIENLILKFNRSFKKSFPNLIE